MNKKILLLITSMVMSLPLFAQNTFLPTGNVGIGTANPLHKLSIYSSIDDSSTIALQSATNSRFYIQQGQNLLKIGGIAYGTAPLNIMNTGNVGIGTTSPTATFEVYGNFKLGVGGGYGGTAYSLGFTRSAGPQLYGTTSQGLALAGTANKTDVVVLPNGNVGIGTATPSTALDVQSGSITVGIGANKAFRTGYISIGNTVLNRMPYISFNALLTTSEIDGQNIFTPIYPNVQSPAGSTGSGLIIMGDPGRSGLRFLQKNYADTSSQNLSSFTEVLTLTSSGTLGIGTTSTGSHKLAVEGSIAARKVKILQSGWADFVFHPNYKLPTLYEVEEFINANQHLPEIPSAAEIEKDGIDVAEIDKKLLQKIEELTLHMIQMRKEMDLLKQENQALKTTIQKVVSK